MAFISLGLGVPIKSRKWAATAGVDRRKRRVGGSERACAKTMGAVELISLGFNLIERWGRGVLEG